MLFCAFLLSVSCLYYITAGLQFLALCILTITWISSCYQLAHKGVLGEILVLIVINTKKKAPQQTEYTCHVPFYFHSYCSRCRFCGSQPNVQSHLDKRTIQVVSARERIR
jgi:hypothetical protein